MDCTFAMIALAVAFVVSVLPKPDVIQILNPLVNDTPGAPPMLAINPLLLGGISIAKMIPVAEPQPLNPVPAS